MAKQSNFNKFLETLKIKKEKKFSLNKLKTKIEQEFFNRKESEIALSAGNQSLSKLQDKLFAENKHSVLIVLQAMDAAGKDGVIKHVMSGFNPQGVKVASFKAPSGIELDHDYFWRHYRELPGKGEIGIFNRSHYENVLVTRVHPEYILTENVPGIKNKEDISEDFWKGRFKQINRFEKNLSENGTLILKFFLHVSKEEQKKRFLERIDNPNKNWKFSTKDIEERKYWDEYQQAYDQMLAATSTKFAPWYVIPADDKWFTRLCIVEIIQAEFEKLKLNYPVITTQQFKELQQAKEVLLSE